jgi:hypothetical protein
VGRAVPTFIDRHGPVEAIPAAARDQLVLEALHQVIDSHGAKPVTHWLEDGVIYCVIEAADIESMCRHHTRRGLRCDDVHLISGLRVQQPLSDADRTAIRTAIDETWPRGNIERHVPGG